MKTPTRKTPLARLASASKAADEFVFVLREDLDGTQQRVEAELLFYVGAQYQTRGNLAAATEPCTVEVTDLAGMGWRGWRGQRGRARWRSIAVTEEGQTVQKLVGEVLSLENIGPIFWAQLHAAMGWTQSVGVNMTICGEVRDDLQVKDVHGYIPSGKALRKDWHVRCFWNYDEEVFELLDCPYCPVTA